MTEPPRTAPVGVVITQREVYDRVERLDEKIDTLTAAVSEMVSINKRLDQHHNRQNQHGERIRVLEAKLLAHAVIVGIMTTALSALVVQALTR